MQRICGHCDKYLNHKSYKEHRRLHFSEGKWLREMTEQPDESSRSSSPLCVFDHDLDQPVPLDSDGYSGSDLDISSKESYSGMLLSYNRYRSGYMARVPGLG